MKIYVILLVAIVAVGTTPVATVAKTCLQVCEEECSLTDHSDMQQRCRRKCEGMVAIMEEYGLKKDTYLCRAVPSKFIAEGHLKNSLVSMRDNLAQNLEGRYRRLFKAHGRWCGPNWTDGKKISAGDYYRQGGNFRGFCIDKADCACRLHDQQCAMAGGCCKRHDRTLIHNLKGTNSPWISSAMRIASWTRDC